MTEPAVTLPSGYPKLLEELKRTVATARWRPQRVVSSELIGLYWRVGHAVLQRQQAEGWGTRVIDRLADDLRAAFPGMRGQSQRNLVYMRAFAAAFPGEITQQPVAQLPWGHVTVWLDKLEDPSPPPLSPPRQPCRPALQRSSAPLQRPRPAVSPARRVP